MTDVIVIGGGPAGLSAAINTCARGATCLVIAHDVASNPLAKSKQVDNYPGMRGVSGKQMLTTMTEEAKAAGAQFHRGTALSVAAWKDQFMVAVGNEMFEAKRVILATGVHTPKAIPGEQEHLGRGVSYCATCDGMLYRGKTAFVTGNADDLSHEAALLQKIGVHVTVVGKTRPSDLPDTIPFAQASTLAIEDGEPLCLRADDVLHACDAVFILRNEHAASTLVPGLETDGRFIQTDRQMRTNIPGLFAAGDCVGKPLQIAKAVSDGLIAAWYATESLS